MIKETFLFLVSRFEVYLSQNESYFLKDLIQSIYLLRQTSKSFLKLINEYSRKRVTNLKINHKILILVDFVNILVRINASDFRG